jgi:hypothetical protein
MFSSTVGNDILFCGLFGSKNAFTNTKEGMKISKHCNGKDLLQLRAVTRVGRVPYKEVLKKLKVWLHFQDLTEEIANHQSQVDGTVDSGLELMKHISSDEALQLKDKLDSLQRRFNDLTTRGADLLKHAQVCV